jgi:hypothetical protein
MLNGVMLLWFLLTAMALGFVAVDIRSTPVPPVMKWASSPAPWPLRI